MCNVSGVVTMVTLLLLCVLPPEGAGDASLYTGEKKPVDQCSGNCTGIKEEENYYFDGYSENSIHEQMIADSARTDTYRDAILYNAELFRDKVVADVGAGTGILSLFCVQAGAKKVYAIEASRLASLTQKIVDGNKMAEKITVVNSKVEIADLPEKVDVIVSEWMGYSLLFENMLPTVLLARDRWLKEGGALLPDKADLYIAPVRSDGFFDERLDFWDMTSGLYDIDLSPMKDLARSSLTKRTHEVTVRKEDLMAGGVKIKHFNINTLKEEDLKLVKGSFSFTMHSRSRVYGFTLWFDVDFPGGFTLSTSPLKKTTHWYQTLVYVDEPFNVPVGTDLTGSIELKPNDKNPRFLDITIEYSVEGRDPVKKTYLMDG